MSIASTLIGAGLTVAAIAFPEAAPILSAIKALEPYGEAAIPIIRDAIKEGPAAFAAAKEKAPGLFADLAALATQFKIAQTGEAFAETSDHDLAAFMAVHVVGVDPPGWVHADTVRWMAGKGIEGQ